MGVIRAAQTMAQLAEGEKGERRTLEAVEITDWPAFKLRGYLHDVGRSFISIEELMHEIDLLSRFKVNTFHFHLTENQAWRFEVRRYPELTESMTRFQGMYYTQEQCRELEEYAAQRGVVVIPEIDMPGHSAAFERAMGCEMQSEEGMAILQDILEEVAEVFVRAPYIHIGADEKRIYNDSFLKTMTDKVHSLGKLAICWNPIYGVTISKDLGFDMTQMWGTAGKMVKGLPNIDCRYNYANHFDVFADLIGIYLSNIYYSDKGSEELAGTISAYWNDRQLPSQEDIIRQNNFYANVLASAERAWIGGGRDYIETSGTALPVSGAQYEEFADWERRFLFHKSHSLKNEPISYVRQSDLRWNITAPMPDVENNIPVTELKSEYQVAGAGVYLRHTWTPVASIFPEALPGNVVYAWTYIYSPKKCDAGAFIEFQNYSRSERDQAPPACKWDFKGSQIWLNDEELAPPVWENNGKAMTNEDLLLNENFTARPPVQVKLKKGWNKVVIRLPYKTLARDEVRLNKWMFTFVLSDPQGNDALEGIRYSLTAE